MDDVEVTDVDDAGAPLVEKVPLRNQDLSFFSHFAAEVLSEYGWYLLVLTTLAFVLIQYLRRTRPHHPGSPPQTQQDAALVARRQEAMEAARRKMQEELDAKAAVFREKQRQQEEEKRRQKIEIWDSMQEGRSYKGAARLPQQTAEDAGASGATLKPKTDKKPLRTSDYNPLTGQGGSCSWRPGRRGPSSGG